MYMCNIHCNSVIFQKRISITTCLHLRRLLDWDTSSLKQLSLSITTSDRCLGSTPEAPGQILPITCHRYTEKNSITHKKEGKTTLNYRKFLVCFVKAC